MLPFNKKDTGGIIGGLKEAQNQREKQNSIKSMSVFIRDN